VIVALVIAAIGVVAVLAAVPLLLPWPQHVRWLIASTALQTDPCSLNTGVAPVGRLEEVTVCRVTLGQEGLIDVATETTNRSEHLSMPAAASSDVARLQRWASARTPLLQITGPSGEVSLYGPTHAVVGLRVIDREGNRTKGTRPEGGWPGQRPVLGELELADLDLLALRPSSPSRPQLGTR